MNEVIESLFQDFNVGGNPVPVSFLFYEGHGEPYVVYMQTDADASLSGDNYLIGYIDYYDFDVYSTSDYTAILEAVKSTLEGAGFRWQPSRTSGDLYDVDTGYYHKTLSFAIPKEVDING